MIMHTEEHVTTYTWRHVHCYSYYNYDDVFERERETKFGELQEEGESHVRQGKWQLSPLWSLQKTTSKRYHWPDKDEVVLGGQ